MKLVAFDMLSAGNAWEQLTNDRICDVWNIFVGKELRLSPTGGPVNSPCAKAFVDFKRICR